MSLCKNTILKSEITSTPIKLKYSQALGCGGELGIQFARGINGPVNATGSLSNKTLLYRTIRQLYYMNYLSGSVLGTGSAWDSNWQSTAASGTFEYDNRYFPSEYTSSISVLSIPRTVFGERVAATSFNFSNADCTLVDDGNGNIIDSQNNDLHVGNIVYSQGTVVITHKDYQQVFPRKPELRGHYVQFDEGDTYEFDMLMDEDSGSGVFDYSSLVLFGTEQSNLFTVNTSSGHVTLNPPPSGTGMFKTYYTAKNLYNNGSCSLQGNVATCVVEIFKELKCNFAGSIFQNDCRVDGTIRYNYCDLLGTAVIIPPPTPSITPSMTPTVSISRTPTVTRTPTRTPSVTPTITVTISVTPSITGTPFSTISRTPSTTPSVTPTISVTISQTPSVGASATPSLSSTPPPSFSRTPSVTASTSRPVASVSLTPPASVSRTPSVSATPPASVSLTPSATRANFWTALWSGGTNSGTPYISAVLNSNALFTSVALINSVTVTGTSNLLPANNGTLTISMASPNGITSITVNGQTQTSAAGASSFTFSGISGPVQITNIQTAVTATPVISVTPNPAYSGQPNGNGTVTFYKDPDNIYLRCFGGTGAPGVGAYGYVTIAGTTYNTAFAGPYAYTTTAISKNAGSYTASNLYATTAPGSKAFLVTDPNAVI